MTFLTGAQRLARQWIHVVLQYTWLLDEFPLISTSNVDSDPEVLFTVLTQNGERAQSMPQVKARACAVCTRKSGVFSSLTRMAVVMMTGGE